MASIFECLRPLAALPIGVLLLGGAEPGPRFLPDDPMQEVPAPLPVTEPRKRGIDELADFVLQSARPDVRPKAPALSANTLGEVPDSDWYTNRHAFRRMSREELQRGPGDRNAPEPPFTVTAGKSRGITPGFQMRDARGRLYYCKPDPRTNPEMATAAEMIGSRIFYALGYNTPENYLVRIRRSDLRIDKKTMITGISGRERRMRGEDLNHILSRAARAPDGTVRMLASLDLPGKAIGPFRYEGTRTDDPNDTVRHERRRELRGLAVFAAWVNHTDAKGGNTLDVIVEERGVRHIKHYLIDFGAILGSASDMPKPARTGNAYMIPTAREFLVRAATLGIYSPAWERANYPDMPAAGRFESDVFDPLTWVPNYPNPAFLSRGPGDEFWAARQVMAFTDDDIRALVETGGYSDPAVAEYIVQTLIARRDKIGRAYLAHGFALDRFRVEEGELRFDDLAAKYGFGQPAQPRITWSWYDNNSQIHERVAGSSFRLPEQWRTAPFGSYFSAHVSDGPDRLLAVYLRKTAAGPQVVGIDRAWEGGIFESVSTAVAATRVFP
ncbi:MAG TPA: hypothetical protein VN428_18390 [Bryobacteraceae bacterium]|nr:hypothetical protein [Bryobacteraceae bacterium]